MLNKKEIEAALSDVQVKTEDFSDMTNDLINKYTHDLDQIMRGIQEDIVDYMNQDIEVPMIVLEKYFMTLTNALYFISSKAEFAGLYEDVAKSAAKLAYNNAFSDNQLNSVIKKNKPTNTETIVYAETASLNETVMSYIVSRAVKMIQAKIDAGYEQVKTISKMISRRMNEGNSLGGSTMSKIESNVFTFGRE